MPRIRTIKPEFWDDQKLSSISRDARLTFIGLWTHSDDCGVVKAHPQWLRNKIFPYDDIRQADFNKWLSELESIVSIVKFSAECEDFYYIRNFKKHQVINRPNKNNLNPAPPDDVVNNHGTITEASLKHHGDITSGREGKGREGRYSRSPFAGSETSVNENASTNGIPYTDIQEAYNLILAIGSDLPTFRDITDKRRKAIKSRWNTDERTCTLAWWKDEFFPLIADSDFLTGRNGKWKGCNIDWILKAENFQKIREGTYNR